ncbi:MAG: Ppx/GppA family phosphatase [Balneola sp.]|nr:MAG: Ppx/GppA family phosphatase [Balneola sp.]
MKAAIDIGTNTVLLLVAILDGNRIKVIREEQRIPRLGKGVDESGVLHQDSINRVLKVLREYKKIISEEYPETDKVFVTATSAVRDAKNREPFIHLIKDELGFEVILLSGDEEARSTFLGALSVLDLEDSDSAFVLDIGGGSTEIALGSKKGIQQFHSFDMGSVRFKERFLKHDPPLKEEIDECRTEIQRLYTSVPFSIPDSVTALAVAGTATTLAAIEANRDEYVATELNGFVIKKESLLKQIQYFSSDKSSELLKKNPVFLKGREDIFLSGLLILEGFLSFYKLEQIIVSTGGIRHGIVLGRNHIKN